jgi:hypothetical protein
MRRSTRIIGLVLALCGVWPAIPQGVNTLELRAGRNDGRLIELAKQSGVILTKEAVAFVSVSAEVSTAEIVAVIRRLPIIHLVVSPVPPRDYLVTINGTTYEPSEESKYGVRPGAVELKVTRAALECVRNLVITKDETVRCDL